MDTYQKLLPYFSPFYNLQYPTTTPERPDSFPDSRYYNTGRLDMCLVISMMAVMAILRDAFRLGFFEPLARYKLYRDLKRKREKVMMASKAIEHKKSLNGNGHVNGCVTPPTTKEIRLIERSVMRFAEQGWSVIYYPLQWAFGIVRSVLFPFLQIADIQCSMYTRIYLQKYSIHLICGAITLIYL